jgi:hypothetical protein
MAFAKFMASAGGRAARIVAGLALIVGGCASHSTAGYVVAVIGVLPLAAGALDWCVFAPLFGMPFRGCDIRRRSEAGARPS